MGARPSKPQAVQLCSRISFSAAATWPGHCYQSRSKLWWSVLFCFAFEARNLVGAGCAALPEEPLSRGRAGCAALLEDFLFCGARVTDSLLISVSESLLSCDGEVAECLASVVPATLAGTNTLATTRSWSALAPLWNLPTSEFTCAARRPRVSAKSPGWNLSG